MNKKVLSLSLIGTLLIIVLGTSLSYAVWISNSTQEDENIAESGCFNVTLTSNTDALLVENDFPKSDVDGMKRDPYSFSIENTCQTDAAYILKIELQSTNDLPSNLTKVALNNNVSLLSDLPNENDNYFVIEESYLAAGETKNYDFRQWFDESGTLDNSQNKTISTKIVLESTATVIPPATEYIANLLNKGDSSLVNDDPDQNIRYIGTDPNNYVSFDGELWRIIGAFDNIKTTEDGPGETRLKIIAPNKSTRIWDTNDQNDWSKAGVQMYLNNPYYISLKDETKSLIGETVWNLGGSPTYKDVLTSEWYNLERGTTVYSNNPTTWTGKIALMYPSDYGYATGGGTTKDRNTCLSEILYDWNISDCSRNNYLFQFYEQWTLTTDSSDSEGAYYISFNGYVNKWRTSRTYNHHPVLYLKSETKIKSGSGTNDDPYILGL